MILKVNQNTAYHSVIATVEAAGSNAAAAHDKPKVIDVDGTMVMWVCITFALMAAVLFKIAWKPILAGLDAREDKIRTSLEDAEKARDEMAKIQEKQQELINEADAKAKEIVSSAKEQALEVAKLVEEKAREEALNLKDNALKEIESAKEQATTLLRKESAEIIVSLAGKLLGENLNDTKNKALADKLIKEL